MIGLVLIAIGLINMVYGFSGRQGGVCSIVLGLILVWVGLAQVTKDWINNEGTNDV